MDRISPFGGCAYIANRMSYFCCATIDGSIPPKRSGAGLCLRIWPLPLHILEDAPVRIGLAFFRISAYLHEQQAVAVGVAPRS